MQLMQDFLQYRNKMELFFTVAQVAGVHTGDPAGRSITMSHSVQLLRAEKAIVST